jgi:hypothetical protein
MAELFQIGVGTVNHHLKAIYEERELRPEATIRRYRIVRTEGSDRSQAIHINLVRMYPRRLARCRGLRGRHWLPILLTGKAWRKPSFRSCLPVRRGESRASELLTGEAPRVSEAALPPAEVTGGLTRGSMLPGRPREKKGA